MRPAAFLGALGLLIAGEAGAVCPASAPIYGALTCSSTISGRITAGTPSYLGGSCPAGDCYTCGTPYGNLPQTSGEHLYEFECQATGSVTLMVTGLDCDLDIYILDSTCDPYSGCRSGATNASTTTDSVTFTCTAGSTYYIAIEGYGYEAGVTGAGDCNLASEGDYTLSFDVSAGTGCPEDCDNGLDDDFDTFIDCADPDCFGDPVCTCDLDGDGFEGALLAWCSGPDCNDEDPDVYPGAPEAPDGVDQDCDSTVDEGTVWYDDDGDGYTEAGGDCDDRDASVNPAEIETCDGVDEDCDGTVDEGTDCYDDDGDGYTELDGDCSDGDPDVNPGETEIIDNGVDDDCDGVVDDFAEDPDGDGYLEGAGDCDEGDPTTYEGAPELADGIDNDCDGVVDEGTDSYDDDGDGFSEDEGDCNDADDHVNPKMPEVADGKDNDCDGTADEGTDQFDDDGDGLTEEAGDCNDADRDIHPGADEVINGKDDDCDGETDELDDDADGDGYSVAEGDCDDTDGWVNPGMIEMCDGVDNDCNGAADDGCEIIDAEGVGKSACGCGTTAPAGGLVVWLVGLWALGARRREEVAR